MNKPAIEKAKHRTRKEIEDCARWLSYCIDLGWDKSNLQELEDLWWEYHDDKSAAVIEEMNDVPR